MSAATKWVEGNFVRVVNDKEVIDAFGLMYKGLAMHRTRKPTRTYPGEWLVTHVSTGHAICFIMGAREKIFEIASELAEASDWDFDGLSGWQNRDSELPAKIEALSLKYWGHIQPPHTKTQSDDMARAVLAEREG